MAIFDDVRRKLDTQQPQQPQTFAQMQRQGYARPPQGYSPYNALVGAAHGPEQLVDSLTGPSGAYGGQNIATSPRSPNSASGVTGVAPRKPIETGAPGLNQGNLEEYLFQTLSDPTKTLPYQNTMKRIGADIDTDASRRGVFYSTLPVGAYSQAGSDLAANMQEKAYGNLSSYENDYTQQLLALLGMS